LEGTQPDCQVNFPDLALVKVGCQVTGYPEIATGYPEILTGYPEILTGYTLTC